MLADSKGGLGSVSVSYNNSCLIIQVVRSSTTMANEDYKGAPSPATAVSSYDPQDTCMVTRSLHLTSLSGMGLQSLGIVRFLPGGV